MINKLLLIYSFTITKIFLFLSCIIIFFSVNISLAYTAPIWYIQNDYDKDKYLIGLGEAYNLEEAKSQAFADIGRVFGVSVKQNAQKKYLSYENDKKVISSTSFSSDVSLASHHNLVNVKIEKQEQDPKTRKYYILALMDKKETAVLLENTVYQNIEIISHYLTQIDKEDDYIIKSLLVNKALNISQQNDVFIKQMFILDKSLAQNINMPNAYKYQTLFSSVQMIDSQIKFNVSNQYDLLAHSIKNVLTDMDFNVSNNKPTHIFEPEFFIKKRSKFGDNYMIEYSLYIKIKNTKTGVEIKRFSFMGTEMGSDDTIAQQNAMNMLSIQIERDFKDQFIEYLVSLSE